MNLGRYQTLFRVAPWSCTFLLCCLMISAFSVVVNWPELTSKFGGVAIAASVFWDTRVKRFGQASLWDMGPVYFAKEPNSLTDAVAFTDDGPFFVNPKAHALVLSAVVIAGTILWAFGDYITCSIGGWEESICAN